MSKLIIVAGLPGSGKTTLATALSTKLNIVCLHKDAIMERLYKFLEMSSLEDSKRVGAMSIKLILNIVEDTIAHDVDIIIEAPFNYQDDYLVFQSWIEKHKLSVYSVICSIATEERIHRFKNRPRHEAHHDTERDLSVYAKADESVYDKIAGKQIRVTTDKPVEELVAQVIKEMNL